MALGPTLFCRGGNTALSTAVNNSVSYQWLKDDSIIAGAVDSLYSVTDSSGNYRVVFTEAGVCKASSNIIPVSFFNAPVAVINPLGSGNLCQGSIVILEADTLQGLKYQWLLNGTNTSDSAGFDTVTLAGTYNLIVSNSNCSDTSSAFNVVVNTNAPPTVSLSGYPQLVCYNTNPFVLSGDSPPGGNFSGPGINGNIFYPDSAFLGINMVTYTYTDSNGCSGWATDSIILSLCTDVIKVNEQSNILLFPNPATEAAVAESDMFITEKVKIMVYDLSGKIMAVPYAHTANQIVLSTTNLDPGLYFTRFILGESICTKILVKASH
jgi:hypothetical protein